MKAAPGSLSPSPLDARLVLYTAAGASLLLTPGAAEAQTIVYSGVQNIVRSSGDLYHLDLNGDSTVDFTLTTSNSTDNANHVDVQAGSNQVVKEGIFAVPLVAGATLNGGTSGFSTGSAYIRKESGATFGEGPWPQATERYLGLQFSIGGGTHYGWARVTPVVGDNSSSFVLHDWAYNSEARGTILTGQTSDAPAPSAVPEPSSLALFAAGSAAALGLLRRRRAAA